MVDFTGKVVCRRCTFLQVKTMNSCTCIAYILFFVTLISATEVLRPRGVPLSNKIFYDPTRDFSCLDGSAIVPFNFVNDDYCDCGDGSDEPGTAACTNGIFHCTNAGHIPQNIPSSRVNDGICDCCDASDEYNSTAECISNCRELGQRAREEAQRKLELHRKGYELRQDLIKRGKQKREEYKSKLEEMQKQESETSQIKDEKDVIKREAEDKEKEVLEKYKSVEEEKRLQKEAQEMELHQEEEKKNAEEAFQELDKNEDGVYDLIFNVPGVEYLKITYQELQDFPIFDSNRDGAVSEEEAKFFLHMKDEMEMEEFITTGWMIMKPIYMMDKITSSPPSLPKENIDDDINDGVDDINEDDLHEGAEDEAEELDGEEETEDAPKFPPNAINDTADKKEIIYDEESQKIIDEAKKARDDFFEAERNHRKVQDEVKELQQSVETDFGPDEEFATLKEQCFEYDEREYTYKLCPFERAAQIPKSGGSEVSLGRGGTWVGPEHNKYTKLKLDGGMVCWNGPARSVVVSFHCGLDNKVVSASEPNRCEYHFDFYTPTACKTPPSDLHNIEDHESHDEL